MQGQNGLDRRAEGSWGKVSGRERSRGARRQSILKNRGGLGERTWAPGPFKFRSSLHASLAAEKREIPNRGGTLLEQDPIATLKKGEGGGARKNQGETGRVPSWEKIQIRTDPREEIVSTRRKLQRYQTDVRKLGERRCLGGPKKIGLSRGGDRARCGKIGQQTLLKSSSCSCKRTQPGNLRKGKRGGFQLQSGRKESAHSFSTV